MTKRKIRVFETSQFAMGKHVEKLNFKKILKGVKVESKISKTLFPGMNRIKLVSPDERPSVGFVWYIQKRGKMKLYKTNYDTSD